MTQLRPTSLITLLVSAILLLGCRSSQPQVTAESPVLFKPYSMAMSPDGGTILMSCRYPNYEESYHGCTWSTPDGRQGDGAGAEAVAAWSPEGSSIASAFEITGEIEIYDLDEQRVTHRLEGHTPPTSENAAEPAALAFSPDGALLASALEQDSTVRLWRMPDGAALHTLDLTPEQPISLAFSSDGARLAVATAVGAIHLWDVASGALLPTDSSTEPRGTLLSFSPDGRWLAVADPSTGLLALWDATTRQPVMSFPEVLEMNALAFSPDSTQLAFSVADDRTIRLWAPEQGEQLILTGHVDTPHAVIFSPDGRFLYSASEREGILQWEVATGALRRRFDLPKPIWM